MLATLVGSTGCQLIYPGRSPHGPTPNIPEAIPREQFKVSLPDYLIEPPDILSIEAINLVPKSPYSLRVFDVVTIGTAGLDEETIEGDFTVQPDGTIQLGYSFGSLQAAGLTREQIEADILAKLKESYKDPKVWVTIAKIEAQQQIAGEHLVAPDGRVSLGSYGRVLVVGLTMDEAKLAIQDHLAQYLENPEVSVDVLGYNSKVFYVVSQGAGLGDQVVILPARGNETVLDAIGQIQGLQSNSSTRMWLARPGFNEAGGDQILPVDWLAITQRGDISTNYQIMPGDRLFVSEDKLVALDTAFGKFFSPFERIFGVTLLGTQTSQRIKFFNTPNAGFGGTGLN